MKNIWREVKQIILAQPPFFLILHAFYAISFLLFRHVSIVSMGAFFFLVGNYVGMYLLSFIEQFLNIHPSPFRTVFFMLLLSVALVFIVTSSANSFAVGIVLSVYLHLLLLYFGELRIRKTMSSWFRMTSIPTGIITDKWFFGACALFFLAMTFIAVY
jgi:hypothetical protein